MDDKKNVHIQTMPNHYVGSFVGVTIHVREKDVDKVNIVTLRKQIELDISTMNSMNSSKFI